MWGWHYTDREVLGAGRRNGGAGRGWVHGEEEDGLGSKVTAGSVTESGHTNQVALSGRADARSQRCMRSGV